MKLRTESVTFSEARNVTLDAYVIETPSPSVGHLSTADIRPAIVILPGGGYALHADREKLPAALPFIAQGYQVFVLSYSIGEHSVYPNPLIDASMAVRWVRANAERLHIDADKIALMGFSAGGHCAAMLATQWHIDTWKQLEEVEIERGGHAAIASYNNKPNAALLCYATTDLRAFPNVEELRSPESGLGAIAWQRAPEANPIDYIDEKTCPTFLWHTAEDETVPALQSIDFARKLQEYGVPVELHLFERGAHGLGTGDKLSDYGLQENLPTAATAWVNLATAWLNDQFKY